jgi:hypothetical protein
MISDGLSSTEQGQKNQWLRRSRPDGLYLLQSFEEASTLENGAMRKLPKSATDSSLGEMRCAYEPFSIQYREAQWRALHHPVFARVRA